MLKKCFGIISWFPDDQKHREQRLERLNKTFKHLIDLFGNDIEFLIIAQNWQDYKVPEFIKYATIHKFDKLGILGARKMLRTKFLESKYDYLIMCDDDIILEEKVKDASKKYLEELDKHPNGFSFIRYGWSLTFCAISRYIYNQEEMVDVDPEKNEGYEDVVFPRLLYYKYPKSEFKTNHLLNFLQNTGEYQKNHKSTWMNSSKNYNEIQSKTNIYLRNFENGNFNIAKIKAEIDRQWAERRKLAEETKDRTVTGQLKGTFLYF